MTSPQPNARFETGFKLRSFGDNNNAQKNKSRSQNAVVQSSRKHATVITAVSNNLSIIKRALVSPEVRVLSEAALKVLIPGLQCAKRDVGDSWRRPHLLLRHRERPHEVHQVLQHLLRKRHIFVDVVLL